MNVDLKYGYTNMLFLKIVPIVLLILATMNMPYDYYFFLRVYICVTCIIHFWTEFNGGNLNELYLGIFAGGAILFNPIIPLSYGKHIWVIIDYFYAITFGLLLITDILAQIIKSKETLEKACSIINIGYLIIVILLGLKWIKLDLGL